MYINFVPNAYSQACRSGEKLILPDQGLELRVLESTGILTLNPIPDTGQLNIFIFWMSTCGPCIKEMDAISKLYPRLKSVENIRIIAISTDKPGNLERARQVEASHNWLFSCYHDHRYLYRNLFMGDWYGTPQLFIVDCEGTIRYHKFGYKSGDEYELEDIINR